TTSALDNSYCSPRLYYLSPQLYSSWTAEGSMKAMPENPNRGSSFEDFLKEEGILEASTTSAVKKVLAWQIEQAMRTQHITKSAMAARMHTSRSQLERLLDPEKTGVSLETIQRAAAVVGRELRIELV